MHWNRPKKRDADLDRELQSDLELEEEEQRDKGLPPEEAHFAARRAFGNPALIREQTRSAWSWIWLESIAGDLRYSIRTLARTPGFALIAIGVIALGIGANVAIFAVVRSVLLNPLPYRDPGKLVALYSAFTTRKTANLFAPIDAGSFYLWQQASQDKAEMALISPFQNYNVSAEGNQLPERVDSALVSGNFFSVMGVPPALGRTFTDADDRVEAQATAILSNSLWKRRYAADPGVIGRTIWLDSRPYTIVGVLPESFLFLGPFSSGKIQVWTPVRHEAPRWLMTTFEDHEFVGVARLKSGVTLSQLLSSLTAVQAHIKAEHPGPPVRDIVTGHSLLDDVVQQYETPLYVLFAATACVLLIACLNVASLLVARTAARRTEVAIRTALGGGRMRLVRERVIESFLLAATGGVLGIVFAGAAIRWLRHARPDIPRVDAIHLDWTSVLFALSAIAFCAVFSGLISAFSIDGRRILSALQESSRAQSGSRLRAGLRRGLLVLEVCLTVVLLVGAGLLLKSYSRLRSTDIGVPTQNVLTLGIGLPEARYKTPVEQVAFLESMIERVRAVPGVQSAALVSRPPGQGWGGDRLATVVEHPSQPEGGGIDMMVRGADPGYFTAIGLPILLGRTFATDEKLTRDHVVLISREAVKVAFPGENPIGKHLKTVTGDDVYQIIGVVDDVRYSVSELPRPMMYMPIYGNGYTNVSIVVRSAQDVDTLALPIQKVIGQLDRDLPVFGITTLQESIAKATVASQFDSFLVLGFAGIALILAAAGIYGVLAYLVTQRTSEIGIRIALGARREQVLRLMLADGLQPALIGLLFGLAGSAAAVRLIRSLLYQTEPFDLSVFVAVSGALLLVSALACLAPAWRASRLDPMRALRTE